MKKLLLLLLLISMQSHSMSTVQKFKPFRKIFPQKQFFSLLSLPDDLIREIMLFKVHSLILPESIATCRSKAYRAVQFCNLMANTCRKMKSFINSDLIILSIIEKCEEKLYDIIALIEMPRYHLNIPLIQKILEIHPDRYSAVIHSLATSNKTYGLIFFLADKFKKNNEIKLVEIFGSSRKLNIEVLNILLPHTSNINAQDAFGKTALHYCTQSYTNLGLTQFYPNSKTFITTLLAHNADPTIEECNGLSPLDYTKNHKEISKIFENYIKNKTHKAQ